MCDCLEEISKPLREKGVWADRSLSLKGTQRAIVSTSWYPGFKPKRGERCPVLIATFCPLCGERYPDEE